VAQQLWRVIKPGGVVVWVVNDETIDGSETGESFRQALWFKDIGFRLHDTMIYRKKGTIFPESNRYYPAFEYMFILSRGKPVTTNLIADIPNAWAGAPKKSSQERQPDGTIRRPKREFTVKKNSVRQNVWDIDAGKHKSTKDAYAFEHPAIFPEALARDHILSWSN
jgi:site-specific DNA-methyltransferase (adenine-specific)